jgi:hypothetical protein
MVPVSLFKAAYICEPECRNVSALELIQVKVKHKIYNLESRSNCDL